MAVFKSGSLLLELVILGEKRDVQVGFYSVWLQGSCVSGPQGKGKKIVLLLNIQTKYFVIMMLSEYDFFTQNNIITLYLLFVLLVSLRMFLWEDLRGFLSWWEWLQKCFIALLRAFSLQNGGLNLNEDLLLWGSEQTRPEDSAVCGSLILLSSTFLIDSRENSSFSARYSKFNSCNTILFLVFSRKTQSLGVY